MKTIKIGLFLLLCSYLISCGRVDLNHTIKGDRPTNNNLVSNIAGSNLAEVATPGVIKELNRDLEQYQPRVKIISPRPNQTFNQTDITVKLQIEDLPIFKDARLELGNHLNLIVDNEPLREIYSVEEPIAIAGLSPGTHTIRVFAARPWGESFKTEGAYAQTTFNILTETNDNRPDPNLPLLTYSSPTGTYSAEPFLLDFYLANAPLHAIAQNDPNLSDWRVRATVNGTSFVLENWQPIYLTGIKPGENWVQLELIDEAGNDIENVFNNTVRVFTFDPQQQDTLAKLINNDIPLAEAKSIVEQNYYIQPVSEPEIIDLEDNTEPEIITGESRDSLDKSNLSPENVDQAIEPAVFRIPANETNQINPSGIIENTTQEQAEPRTILPEGNKTQIDSNSTPLNEIYSQAETNSSIAPVEVQPEQPVETIVINEAETNSEEPVAIIDIPEPESVEITESEIAITIPKTESSEASRASNNNLKTKFKTPLWWKKILVGLRQKLEALARSLPSQAELS